jgi:Lar family restriction alleviation protein
MTRPGFGVRTAQNPMDKCLPCPFCGSHDVAVIEGETFRWRLVECHGCGAQGPDIRIQTMGSGTLEKWEATARKAAMAEWNKRSSHSAGEPR